MSIQNEDARVAALHAIAVTRQMWRIFSDEAAMLWTTGMPTNVSLPVTINCALSEVNERKYPPGPGINTLCMDELAAELLTRFAAYGIKYLSDDHLEILSNALDRECFRRNGGPVEV